MEDKVKKIMNTILYFIWELLLMVIPAAIIIKIVIWILK